MRRLLTLNSKIWVLSFLIILGLAIYLISDFDPSDAIVTNGQRQDIDLGWKMEDIDGNLVDISLPRTIIADGDAPTAISIILHKGYAGLTLVLTVNNSVIRAYADSELIYESIRENGSVTTVNMIQLPDFNDEIKLSVELFPISSGNMVVRSASVTRGDIAIISQLKASLFQLFCCVMILLSDVILAILELLRKHSRWDENYLHRLSVFGLVGLAYCLTNTQLPSMFYGNAIFFSSINGAALALLPMLFFYYHDGVSEYAKNKLHSLLFGISVLSGIVGCMLFSFSALEKIDIKIELIVCLVFAVIATADLLSVYVSRTDHVWIIGCIGLVSIIIFCVLGIISSLVPKDYRQAMTFVLTLSLMSFAVWQTFRLVVDYKTMMEESEQEALRASEAKGRFLANMSHEIRTPINAVLGMDEMILRNARDDDIRGWASDIHSAGSNLLSIVNDILDISKIESGKMELVPADYDVCSLINDTMNMIKPKADAKGLVFSVAVDPAMPTMLHGDEAKIRQIMTNLLSNAVKYTQKGNVWLRIRWNGDKNISRCEVKDTGSGIKKKDIPKLFSEYERIEEDKNRNIEGTGLGMSITMDMLSLMGSRLKVKSEYGKGSLFWFDVKQEVIDETPIGDFDEKIKALSAEFNYSVSFTAPEARILVVDDNEMNIKVFKSLLSDTKVQIQDAKSGQECLILVKREHFDVIFLDHMMPDMDGIETLERIRELEYSPCIDTPVYALTANALSGAKEMYLDAGFDGFVTKPVSADTLEKTIMDALPEDLVKKTEKFEKGRIDTGKKSLSDIDGIDIDYARLHFRDDRSLYAALEDFYSSMDTLKNKLLSAYANLPDKEAIKRYRIEVHGMKGAAATVGAIQLYGLARTLEVYASEEDVEDIDAVHPVFIGEWGKMNDVLKHALNKDIEAGKKTPKKSAVLALVTAIRNSLDVSDIDQMDEAMNKLLDFRYGNETGKLMDELKIAVDGIDDEKIVELTDMLLKKLNK